VSQPRPSTPLNPQIRAEAAAWLLKFNEGDVDTRAREDFLHWLRTSPEHVRAYLRICAFWQKAPHLRGAGPHDDIDALVRLAQREANVLPWETKIESPRQSPSMTSTGSRRSIQPQGTRVLAAVAATLVFLTAGVATWFHSQLGLYTTSVGEQRAVNLPDGSAVVINARSRIRILFSDTERAVELLEGQALFRVARSSARPFIVHAGGMSVRAIGTQFDVYKKAASTVVTVVEGRVAIVPSQSDFSQPGATTVGASTPPGSDDNREKEKTNAAQAHASADSAPGELLVAAGEQAVVTAQAAVKPQSPNITAATAWTSGLLVFDGAPLSEVIQEFNRQNSKAIVLTSPQLATLQISGSFPASGSERIVQFLQQRFHVVVHETNTEIQVSRP
jgi:transmembrane sensor